MRTTVLTLVATAAILLSGASAWNAQAETWRGAADISSAAKNFTPIEKAACFGWGRCAPGFHQVCGPRRCWCARC